MASWICEKRITILQRLLALITTLSLLKCQSASAQTIPTYYLDDYCSRTLDMTMANVKSGRLMLHRPGQNPVFPTCYIMITAPVNKRLTFKFHSFDIETPLGCTSNFLRIYEDHKRQFPITDRLCNSDNIPNRAYITNSNEAAVWLNKENYLLDQVELIFTAFSFSPCLGGDFQCDNDHCISSELYCNDQYDNCGDESDICLLKHGTVVGIIAAVVVVVVILAILLALYMIRRQRKIRREKVAHIIFVNPDQKSQMSFLSDGKSSTLRKQPSLLSNGSSYAHYPGVRTIAFTGTKAHSLGYLPFVATTTPMSSPYSTLNRDGVVLGSNLGEKTRSSIRSKPGKASFDKTDGLPAPSASIRKRPSGDLRPPFYFDKDGYFSDSSASQSNSSDKFGRRSSLDTTDARKKKKFMGRFKIKTKKGKDEKFKPSKLKEEKGRMSPSFKDYKEVPGREQMTEDLYIDGRQLTKAVDVPEIRVTHAQEQNNSGQAMNKDQSTPGNDNETGKRLDSSHAPAGTSVKSAEALNLLMERRKARSEEPHQSEMSALKIQPRTMTADAVVHHPGHGEAPGSNADDNNDSIHVIETVVESPAPSFDTVDGRAQTPTPHISVLTLPAQDSSRPQREGTGTAGADTADYNIQTVVENSPTSFDRVDNRTHGPALTRPMAFPETSTGKGTQKFGESPVSNSNGEDEVDSYPQTNFQLADQSVSPRSSTITSQEQSSPATSVRPLSPTRQMGLSARHPDGSPFLLHKVSQKSVDKQLKQHPEDRADVRDHVVSFRSYPAPVHSWERAGLFRNSSRRSARYSDSKESL